MHCIIRSSPTGHRYVHSDGQRDMTFTTCEAAAAEVSRIKRLGSAHDATIHSEFKNTRQAREFCRSIS